MQHLEMQHQPVGPQGALIQAANVLGQHPAAAPPLPVLALQAGVVQIICAAGTAGGMQSLSDGAGQEGLQVWLRVKSLLAHVVQNNATLPQDAPPPRHSPDSLSLLYPLLLLPATPAAGDGLAPRPPLCLRRSVLPPPLASPPACEAAIGER
jgi:hypothetical protein